MITKIKFLLGISLLLIITYSCSNKGTSHIDEMKLNGKVKSIEEVTYKTKKGEIVNTYLVQFNFYGNKVNEILKGPDNSIYSKITYYYNNLNYNIKQIFYDKDDKVLIKMVYDYNKEGMPSSLIIYDSDDKIIGNGEYNYNEKGELMKFYSFDTTGILTMEESYLYDSLGYINSKESYLNNEFLKYEYNRDIKGYPIFINVFNKKGDRIEKQHYVYKWDDIGNWIERTEMINDTIYERKTRKLTYY